MGVLAVEAEEDCSWRVKSHTLSTKAFASCSSASICVTPNDDMCWLMSAAELL